MIIKELQKIGLSEKEAAVYAASLELGQSPVQKISEKANVNRSTTYVILESLMKKGVITTYDKGKKTYYMAEPPHTLKNVIRQQEEELKQREVLLESMMPELQSVYNLLPNKPVVRFFDGKEGLKAMQDDFLQSQPSEADTIYSIDDVEKIFTVDEMKEMGNKRRAQKRIKVRGILTSSKPVSSAIDEYTDLVQVSADEYPIHSDISIYNDKIQMASLKGHVSGVIIESKAIADTLRSIFKLAFKGAKK